LKTNAKNLKKFMTDVTQSITDNKERLNMAIDDKIAGLLDDLKRNLTANIDKNVPDIKSNKNSIDDLKSTVIKLENMIEWNNKCNDLIVKGIPVLISENPPTLYQKMPTILGYATDSATLVEVFHLGKKKAGAKHDPPLLIKFENPFERQRFRDKYSELPLLFLFLTDWLGDVSHTLNFATLCSNVSHD
jgi:polyhydroxyalkanoate synthesis regulator phasin